MRKEDTFESAAKNNFPSSRNQGLKKSEIEGGDGFDGLRDTESSRDQAREQKRV